MLANTKGSSSGVFSSKGLVLVFPISIDTLLNSCGDAIQKSKNNNLTFRFHCAGQLLKISVFTIGGCLLKQPCFNMKTRTEVHGFSMPFFLSKQWLIKDLSMNIYYKHTTGLVMLFFPQHTIGSVVKTCKSSLQNS